MRVLIVDDHPLFADGLAQLLTARGLDVVGVAYDGHGAIKIARRVGPDVVLTDLDVPGLDGVAVVRAIKAALPDAMVLVVTDATDNDHLFAALAAGASGYVPKSESTESFMRLLEGAVRGELAVPPPLAVRLLREFARLEAIAGPQRDEPALTPRQREVLNLVAHGLLYKQVAVSLGITERSVKYHMAEVFARLHVHSRGEAVAVAHGQGLAP